MLDRKTVRFIDTRRPRLINTPTPKTEEAPTSQQTNDSPVLSSPGKVLGEPSLGSMLLENIRKAKGNDPSVEGSFPTAEKTKQLQVVVEAVT